MCINCQFVPVCKTSSEAQVTALQLCAYIYQKYKHINTINTGFEKGHLGDPGTKNRDLSLQCTVGLGERRRPPGPGGYTNLYIKIYIIYMYGYMSA